jgi:group I intron endonuclease
MSTPTPDDDYPIPRRADGTIVVSGVYAIVHTASGRTYVGSAKFVVVRWSQHLSDLANGTHHNMFLQRAWDRYGPGAFVFKVLEEVIDPRMLADVENQYFELLYPFYNVAQRASQRKGRRN